MNARRCLQLLVVAGMIEGSAIGHAQTVAKDSCTAVLVPPAPTQEVNRPLAELAERGVRGKLSARGCQVVDSAAVTSMQEKLPFPQRPEAADWVRLGEALLADLVVVVKFTDETAAVHAEAICYQVADAKVTNRSSTVGVADLLATTVGLAEEVLPPRARESELSTSPHAPSVQPRPTGPPPLVAAPPIEESAKQTEPLPAAPPAAHLAAKYPTSAEAPARVNHLLMAGGVRSFAFFSPKRAGPALELEVGGISDYEHWGIFLRPYFGTQTSYGVGGRYEGGPKVGPLRLSFGVGGSFTLIPNTADAIDLISLHAQLAGAVWQWRHLVVLLEAFTLDVHLVPADSKIGRTVGVRWGTSSGLSVGASF